MITHLRLNQAKMPKVRAIKFSSLSSPWFGGMFGRIWTSIQKFNFLPEPIGDYLRCETKFGFLGACILVMLLYFFTLRGLKLLLKYRYVGELLVVGIVIMIVAQAFVNIGAILGVLPLSGITLPFVSRRTSLITLLEVGIILSISNHNPPTGDKQ